MIQTKVTVPPRRGDTVIRSRLLPDSDWIEQGHWLATVVAPAGYGKTTLMVQWVKALVDRGWRCCWLSLDEEENDPARFLTYLIHSIAREVPGCGKMSLAQIEMWASQSLQPVLDALVADLENAGERVALFIDDFHLISNPDTIAALSWLTGHAPAKVGYMVGSRERPALSHEKIRLATRLLEFQARDLSFTAGETAEMMRFAIGRDLDGDAVSDLRDRTEGWAAALQLAALSSKEAGGIENLIREFSGTDTVITDYLAEVVLAKLSGGLREFMLRASVLERMCGEMSAFVTGNARSHALLEEIEARNLFLIPLDREHKWYRFHHLFSDFLRYRLELESPGAAKLLRRRAAKWCHRQNLIDEAIQYAFLAEDLELAAEWIASSAERLVQHQGQHATLIRWMRMLPDPLIDRWPSIRINYAWSLGFSGRFVQAEQEMTKLESYCEFLATSPTADAATRHIQEINRAVEFQRSINYALRDMAAESRSTSAAWLRRWPQAGLFQRAAISVVLGFSCKCTGEFDLAKRALEDAAAAFEATQEYYGLAWSIMAKTVLLARQGRHRDALAECSQGLEIINRELGARSHAGHMLSALLAAMHYERNELEQARGLLDREVSFLDEEASVDPLVSGYITRARLLVHGGRIDCARDALAAGRRLGVSRKLPRLVTLLLAEDVLISLRRGEIEAATAQVERERLFEAGTGSRLSPRTNSVTARVKVRLLLATGRAREGLEVIGKHISRLRRQGRYRVLVEMLILHALLLQAEGAKLEALRVLDQAVRLAAPEGYLRVFLDEGAPVREMIATMVSRLGLSVHSADEVGTRHLRAVAAAFGISSGVLEHRPNDEAGVASVPLTKREQQLLQMLATGRSNKELAEALFVSEGTVKWHLHNMFDKLGARNRAEALARARSLSLLL